jgi:hypothetical protein
MEENRNIKNDKALALHELFEVTTTRLLDACGASIFKTGGTFLLSKFDAVTVGFAKAIASGATFENTEINSKVNLLLADEAYIGSTVDFVNDTGNLIKRVNAAIRIFEG